VFAGEGDEVVASQFGFAVYALAAQAAGATLAQAPAFPTGHAMPRGHDLGAILAAVTPRTRIIYLANPNNPTGTWFGADAFAAFMAKVPCDVLVVVDEAYADYVDAPDYASALTLLAAHPNLFVTRTFSKAHALAGLRVGYAIAHPGLVAVMERVRESFSVNLVGLAAAQAVLGDDEHLRWSVARNAHERERLATALRQRGWFVHPSQTNFLLVEFGAETTRIEHRLLEQGVVVRPMGGYGLPECLRITVGEAGENRRLLAALDAA
jgi:histidinol-phosphate aminotransferase